MNYIKELNAFRNWLLLNELPTSAIALWYTLMATNNMAGWQEWFAVPNSTLQQLTGLSKQGLVDARNMLINKGLIDYQKGKKGQIGKYKMISLVNSLDQSIDQSIDQSLDQSIDQSTYQSLTINKTKTKQNKTKQKEEDEEDKGARPNPFAYYEQNFGLISPIVAEEISQWLDSGSFDEPEEIITLAMKEAIFNNIRSWKYVRKILMDWSSASLRTVDDVKAYQAEWEARKQRSGPRRRTVAESREAAAELTQQRVLDAIASMWHSGMSAESIAEQLKRDPNEILLALVHLTKENKVKRRI